jgi:hypothetical protein
MGKDILRRHDTNKRGQMKRINLSTDAGANRRNLKALSRRPSNDKKGQMKRETPGAQPCANQRSFKASDRPTPAKEYLDLYQYVSGE